VIFNPGREGVVNLFWQAADGTGLVERLTRSPNPQAPTGISPDGTRLVFFETSPTTGDDILQVELTGTHQVTPLAKSPSVERNGVISGDGRCLAYEGNDSRQLETWVRPYPGVSSGRWLVSSGGGTRPVWGTQRTGVVLYVADRRDHGRRRRPGHIVGDDDPGDDRQSRNCDGTRGESGQDL
jgi:Tol biopolymer transport system component